MTSDGPGAMTILEEGRELAEGAVAPVFIHSSWRTGSTWLWEKLRQAPTTIAYCEIFHERLARCDIAEMRDNDFARWNSKHPEGAPYFLEFGPLIGANGAVRGYAPSMAVDDFMPEGGVAGPLTSAEQAYLEGLIGAALARRRVPVLTDTRTLGRFSAIAKACPGRQVLLVRNIFHQWASYSEQWAQGNDYFFHMQWRTIEAARRDPFVALLAEWFDRGEKTPQSAAAFQLFLLFHLYLYASAYNSADLIVDLNGIEADPDARALAEAGLADCVRFPVDLSDVRATFGLSLFPTLSRAAFVDVIDQFAKQAIASSASAEATAFAMRLKDEALMEWERCEFYSGFHRVWAGRRLNEVQKFAQGREAALDAAEAKSAQFERRIGRLKKLAEAPRARKPAARAKTSLKPKTSPKQKRKR